MKPKLLLPLLAAFLMLMAAGSTLASSSAPKQHVTAKAAARKPVRKAIPKVDAALVRRLRR
ncbi:MAG TPA: hypothetical protein VFF36_04785, partial [Planctomycetota bacterium]|nr:hypothetical protein [Planctomycetota bacterium]